MGGRTGDRVVGAIWVAAVIGLASTAGAGPSSRTKITVWAAPSAAAQAFGGQAYGGFAPITGALITEQRTVEVPSSGELRLEGIAATIEPASVQLRDLTEPTLAIAEQRFVPGASTPTQLLAERIGEQIVVVTPKGEVTGVLRSVDDQVLVVESGAADQRRMQVMRRDGYVQDVRLPAGPVRGQASLVWRLAAKQPGRHALELSYRADGMAWSADYLAVLDEPGKTVDFSAWATIKNATGATFEDADVVLVNAGVQGRAAAPAPLRYAIKAPVHLGAGQAVQVELLPHRVGARARTVVAFEAMPDPSEGFQTYANTDCNQFNGTGMTAGRAEVAIELDVPSADPLPAGRARMFRRRGDRLEVVSEEPLTSGPGLARIRITGDSEISGERHALTCNLDERAHTLTETIEIKVENHGKRPTDVVIREFAWRWPVWKLETEDIQSARAGQQALEYRVAVPPSGKRAVKYAVVYSAW